MAAPAQGFAAASTPPLDGVRVIDFGRYIAGPYCATLLGYFGADVIRVERRGGGEDRFLAPLSPEGDGAGWLQTGVNKRSLALDLRHPASRAITRRLIESADVLVANLPPTALRKLGLDAQSASAINPRIIVAAISGFGATGPWADRGAFDGVGQAMSGAMAFSGLPGAPAKAAAPYVDFTTAFSAALGVMAALIARQRDGVGQAVHCSLLESAIAVFGAFLTEASAIGETRAGSGNRVQTSAPSDVFATMDGHILVHCVGDAIFARCADMLGEAGWPNDPRFRDDASRGANNGIVCERLAQWCARRTRDEALAALDKAGVPAGPVLAATETLAHPQVAATGLLQPMAPGRLPASTRVPRPPVTLSRTRTCMRAPAPAAGAQTEDVLREVGYSAEEIAEFRRAAVI